MSVFIILCHLFAFDPNAGTAGFDFLRIIPTAREAGLGGAASANAEGAFSFYYSPINLLKNQTSGAQFSYVNYPAGIHAGAVGYSQPVNFDIGVGVGVYYLNSGTMKRTNEQGDELGYFGASFADLNIAGAMRVGQGLLLGAGLAGLYGGIDSFYSLGLALNLGVGYEFAAENIRLGLYAQNLGLQVKPFGDSRDPMPIEFGLGGAWEPVPAFNLNLGINKPIDNRFNIRLGAEGWLNQYLVLRGGYNSLGIDWWEGSGGDIFAGLTAGLGVRYQRYQIDYSFVPMGRLGLSHRLSLGLSL